MPVVFSTCYLNIACESNQNAACVSNSFKDYGALEVKCKRETLLLLGVCDLSVGFCRGLRVECRGSRKLHRFFGGLKYPGLKPDLFSVKYLFGGLKYPLSTHA